MHPVLTAFAEDAVAAHSSATNSDLLSYEEKKDFPEWRDTVIINVCTFIEKSGRFNSTVTTNSDTRTH